MKNLAPLGKMTAFYIPSHKLDGPGFDSVETARRTIHEFLIAHYKAYTHTPSPVKGYWLSGRGVLLHDVMERFEVSFDREVDYERLIVFLTELAHRLDEESIYLTRGDESFLVNRREPT
ncbi:MAG: hypothetical protein AB7U73_13545 [Pirellulales bacterium]